MMLCQNNFKICKTEQTSINKKGQNNLYSISLSSTILNKKSVFVSDKPELHNRFVKLPINVPQAPLIFSLRHTIERIEKRMAEGWYRYVIKNDCQLQHAQNNH